MAELIADAARDGLTIETWYDDMGISGRGEFLEKREGFERARQDAATGKVGILYARDLSRLFRDLVQQELWFAEMQAAGCHVRIQDLPFVADDATRVLIRQQLGSINQYLATRTGALIRTILEERVRQGLWVGREQSFWGLRYNPQTHGFDYDPTTADRIRTVFDLWIACKGVGGRVSVLLNRRLDAGDPDAIAAFKGGRWTRASVFGHVRNPLYRRETTYNHLRVSMPHLIPEVVDPDIVAEADRLDSLRRPANDAFAAKAKAGRLDHTYASILRCGFCGGKMTTRKPYAKNYSSGIAPTWIAWWCPSSSTGRNADTFPLCPDSFTVQQSRLDALIGEGLSQALAQYEFSHLPPGKQKRKQGPDTKDKNGLLAALRELDERRSRCYDLWENKIIGDMATLQERLGRIAEERGRVESRLALTETDAAPPSLPALTSAQFRSLQTQLRLIWSTERADAFDPDKYDLLASLGVRVRVRILPRNPGKKEQRRQAGRLVLDMEIAALGLVGERAMTLTETQEAFRAHNLWRIRNAHERQRAMAKAGEWGRNRKKGETGE